MTWAALLSTTLVAAERVRFSRSASWAKQDPGQSSPAHAAEPLAPEQDPIPEHFWYRRGANLQMNSNVPWNAPTNFSRPSWSWSNPLDEQVRHSPLIDRNMDVYISTPTRIRKFSKQGVLLWTHDFLKAVDGNAEMTTAPVLYGDSILAVTSCLHELRTIVYSLRLDTGAVNWRREYMYELFQDANSMLAMNDSVVFAVKADQNEGGNRKVVAVSTHDGAGLWEFTAD